MLKAETIIVGNFIVMKDSSGKSTAVSYFKCFNDDGSIIVSKESQVQYTPLYQLKIGKLLE